MRPLFAAYCLAALMSPTLPGQAPSQIVGLGYTSPPLQIVSPGQVVTISVPLLDVPDAVAGPDHLPNSLSGVSVSVRVTGQIYSTTGYPTLLPILRVAAVPCKDISSPDFSSLCQPTTQITVEIPTEHVCVIPRGPTCGSPPYRDIPEYLVLNVHANGVVGPDLTVAPGGGIHLLNSCDTVFGPPQDLHNCHPLIFHGDGTLVNGDHSAQVGEGLVAYFVGHGVGIASGRAAQGPVREFDTVLIFSYRIAPIPTSRNSVYFPLDQFVNPDWEGLTPGYVGLYQINFTVPPMLRSEEHTSELQ